MNKPLSFSPAKAREYAGAMLDAGLDVGLVEITPSGNLRIYTKDNAPSPNTQAQRDDAEYDKWVTNEG